jgi:hypothetical protein
MARIRYKEAAGIEVRRGRPPAGPPPSKADLVKLYVKEGRSVRDVAAITATDRQIDQLVYELYSLSEDEIKIIEGATE